MSAREGGPAFDHRPSFVVHPNKAIAARLPLSPIRYTHSPTRPLAHEHLARPILGVDRAPRGHRGESECLVLGLAHLGPPSSPSPQAIQPSWPCCARARAPACGWATADSRRGHARRRLRNDEAHSRRGWLPGCEMSDGEERRRAPASGPTARGPLARSRLLPRTILLPFPCLPSLPPALPLLPSLLSLARSFEGPSSWPPLMPSRSCFRPLARPRHRPHCRRPRCSPLAHHLSPHHLPRRPRLSPGRRRHSPGSPRTT